MKTRMVLMLSAAAFLLGRQACILQLTDEAPTVQTDVGRPQPNATDHKPLKHMDAPWQLQGQLQGQFTHLDLVLSHCHKSLRWLRSFLTRPISNITIFSKCN